MANETTESKQGNHVSAPAWGAPPRGQRPDAPEGADGMLATMTEAIRQNPMTCLMVGLGLGVALSLFLRR